MTNLTSATARKLVASLDDPVDLKKYTKIKPDVAECLCGKADLDLSGLNEFTPALAAAFSKHQGKLILDGVKTLNKETALALKNHFKGELSFGGITEIEDDVAQILSERVNGKENGGTWSKVKIPKILKFQDTSGHIALFTRLALDSGTYSFDITELTEKQAAIFAQRKKALRLLNLKSISPEVAKALSKSDQEIYLPEIKEVSSQVAFALAGHTGELNIPNLEHVKDELAEELSKHKGPIKIGGIKSMPDSIGYINLARKLVAESPESLSLPIEEVGEKVAEILSGCKRLVLSSLMTLKDTQAHKMLWEKICLNARKNDSLDFHKLKEIPDAFAEILSKTLAKISINGLAKWEQTPGFVALAKRLVEQGSDSSCRSFMYIDAEFFPDKIAEIFAQATCQIYARNIAIFDSSKGNLELARRFATDSSSRNAAPFIKLKKISLEAAKILSAGPNECYMTGELSEITRELFEILFSKKPQIFLPLESLPDDIAGLCEGEKDLVFPKLTTINIVLASSFGNGKGSLNLDGLHDIDGDCLKEIVKREGTISMQGLKCLDLAKAKSLSQIKGNRSSKTGSMYDLNLSGVEEISDEALNSLLELDSPRGLNLNSLKRVSESNALKLSKRAGALTMNGLEALPETQGHVALAQKLASSYWFEPKALKEIGPLVAGAFSSKSDLKLPALTKINVEVARKIAKTKELSLNSLTEISLEVAKELSGLCGKMSLGNVDKISDEAFAELCKNKTDLSFEANDLPVGKARAIAMIPKLYINGLKEVSVDAAKCFNGYQGNMYMSSLSKLSPDAARELRKLKSKLDTWKAGQIALATGL